ncbi:MAG: hypothetical protein ACRDF6_08260, partial [bacterium]
PGELTGWIRPVARAARRLAAARSVSLRVTLALSPSQFAGGREAEVAAGWGLFDQILPPDKVTRLALGLGRQLPIHSGALVHLGGDLWVSSRLAGRFRLPAVAIAETPLVAARHRHFRHIFAVSEEVVERLKARAVPASKVSVSGDPRADAVAAGAGARNGQWQARADTPLLSILPGSRDRLFTNLVPYFLDAASALAGMGIRAGSQIIVSEFLSPSVVERARVMVTHRWPELDVRWITHDPWAAMRNSDLIVTIPGTNTLELAMLGAPFVVVVETDLLQYAPMEGAMEWLARAPVVGPRLRRLILRRVLRGRPYVALPNARAKRMVVPEWVGRWTREDLAKRVAELLADPARLQAIRTNLRGLGLLAPGASDRIAETALALAGRNVAQW